MPKSFEEVKARIGEMVLDEDFDLIVAIANGGIIPAAMINQRLGKEIQLLKLSLRDASQKQLYPTPRLLEPIGFEVAGRKILLVEDRVKSGLTLNYARKLLEEAGAARVKTFAVNGKADYSLYNETCFPFPWIMKQN